MIEEVAIIIDYLSISFWEWTQDQPIFTAMEYSFL